MIKEKILAAYNELAPSYSELIEEKPHNAYYDRPNTLSLLGDVKGKSILDAACGPGKYAELMLAAGAEVTGFDFSSKMIECAKKRNRDKGKFFVHDLSRPLVGLNDESFDAVLCALAMHYVEGWNPVIKEFFRVLRKGGRVVISIEHPFFEYTYFKSKKYFEVEPVKCTWNGFGKPVEIHSFRRSLTDCIGPFLQNGFALEELLEPRPMPEFEKLDPRHFKELNAFPAFMCLSFVKN